MTSAILPPRSKMEQAILHVVPCDFQSNSGTSSAQDLSLMYLRLLSKQMFQIRDQGTFISVATQRDISYVGRVTICYFQVHSGGAVWCLHCDFVSQEWLQVSC